MVGPLTTGPPGGRSAVFWLRGKCWRWLKLCLCLSLSRCWNMYGFTRSWSQGLRTMNWTRPGEFTVNTHNPVLTQNLNLLTSAACFLKIKYTWFIHTLTMIWSLFSGGGVMKSMTSWSSAPECLWILWSLPVRRIFTPPWETLPPPPPPLYPELCHSPPPSLTWTSPQRLSAAQVSNTPANPIMDQNMFMGF